MLYDREAGNYIDRTRLAAPYGLDDLHARYLEVEIIHQHFESYRKQRQSLLDAQYRSPLPALEKVANLSICIPEHVDDAELLNAMESLVRSQVDARTLEDLQFLRSDCYLDIPPGNHKQDGIHLLTANLKLELNQE